ncbi:MAG TPA: hypothetical protein VFY10_09640, partial [Dehalococcoidia bacterium]|nr:hypothetical protein [Dehalococcoidia bacterium]
LALALEKAGQAMTERRHRLSELLADTLARLTTDSSAAPMVAYLQDYEHLVLERGLSPESIVPAETDVQAIFRLIQDLRSLAVEVPQRNARDRFLRQVAIARADYLARQARTAARMSRANSVAAAVAAACILAATASVAGATSGLPKVTLPVSLQEIVDSISSINPMDQSSSDAAPASTMPSNVIGPGLDTGPSSADNAQNGEHDSGMRITDELHQLLETVQSAMLDEQTASSAESSSVSADTDTSKAPTQVAAPRSGALGTQATVEHPAAPAGPALSGQSDSVAALPETPVTQSPLPPDDTQTASIPTEPSTGQAASAPGVTGTTPGQSGATPTPSGAGGSQSSEAPGLTAMAPGLNGIAPGLSGSNPGQSEPAPGSANSNRGQSDAPSAGQDSNPGRSDSTPANSNSAAHADSEHGNSGQNPAH